MPADWLLPQWDAPTNVHAVMTTRRGGGSDAPYDSMNVGRSVGDKAEAVARNRAALQSCVPARLTWMNQVHGDQVLELDADTESGARADACLSRHSGLACSIMIADCLPLLFSDALGTVVAAAHAGWRGLAGQGGRGVIEATVDALQGVAAGELLVWLGPCIGQEAFEVGPEVLASFTAHDPKAAAQFKPGAPRKFHADLQALARNKLAVLGIRRIFGNDGGAHWCTHSNPSRFFSYRRDHAVLGGSGRMVAVIWLD